MSTDPFQTYTLIRLDDFPYYLKMLASDLIKEIMQSPLESSTLRLKNVMKDSRTIIQLDSLPRLMGDAQKWYAKHAETMQDTSDPWCFKGTDKLELLMKAMRRYMSYYMECIDGWSDVLDSSIKDEDPHAFAAFMEAFTIILFVPPLVDSAIEIDLRHLYQKAIDPKLEGDGWMYVEP